MSESSLAMLFPVHAISIVSMYPLLDFLPGAGLHGGAEDGGMLPH